MDKESLAVIDIPSDNAPALIDSEELELPLPDYDQNVSEREIKAIDILQNKFNFAALGVAVKQAAGVDSIIKCVLAIDRLQERRRHLLNISYGAPSTAKKETIIYPLD